MHLENFEQIKSNTDNGVDFVKADVGSDYRGSYILFETGGEWPELTVCSVDKDHLRVYAQLDLFGECSFDEMINFGSCFEGLIFEEVSAVTGRFAVRDGVHFTYDHVSVDGLVGGFTGVAPEFVTEVIPASRANS